MLEHIFPPGINPLWMVFALTGIFMLSYGVLCLIDAWLLSYQSKKIYRKVDLPSDDS